MIFSLSRLEKSHQDVDRHTQVGPEISKMLPGEVPKECIPFPGELGLASGSASTVEVAPHVTS